MTEYLQSGEAAKYLGITYTPLKQWHASGRLVAANVTKGGHKRYTREQLDAFLREDPKWLKKEIRKVINLLKTIGQGR